MSRFLDHSSLAVTTTYLRRLEWAGTQGLGRVAYIDSGCLGLMWVIVESVVEHGWMGIIGALDTEK
jgi:LDH2 family malate/lactate/ureidoglycolate dehydrogenase